MALKITNVFVGAHRVRPFQKQTNFTEEFPCEHGTSFRQICELDFASLRLRNCVFFTRIACKKRQDTNWARPDGALKGTIFAHKIARERQSLFGQKCELVFVRKRTKAHSEEGATAKKTGHRLVSCLFWRRHPDSDWG